MAVDVGTGTTISFGASNWTAEITAINGNNISRAVINTSHLGTEGSHTKMFGDLIDQGEVELTFQWDGLGNPPPIDAAPEEVTITAPDGSTAVGTGGLSSWSWGIPLEDKMTGSATFVWTGAVAYTAGS